MLLLWHNLQSYNNWKHWILDDKGAQALLESDGIKKLKFLNLRHHYMSDDMMSKLKTIGIPINMDDQEEADQDDDEEYRYIEVSE